jgi:hypothetical protein
MNHGDLNHFIPIQPTTSHPIPNQPLLNIRDKRMPVVAERDDPFAKPASQVSSFPEKACRSTWA